jgi:transcriptional regulator with XRE-family HTH domain
MRHTQRSPLLKEVGRQIRKERERQQLTQAALGERAGGWSANFIGKIERGQTNPEFAAVWAIATALGLKLGDLLAAAEQELESR